MFGPYFTDRYKTPWGEAINLDGPYSDEVRHYLIANALYWIDEYHMDALRIDADTRDTRLWRQSFSAGTG